jgi:hypothetical protein
VIKLNYPSKKIWSNKRKESALKAINAQIWKLGAVSLAFVLAITMMISSSPVTKTVEAAACTIDATEVEMTTALLYDAAVTGATEETQTIDNGVELLRLGYGSTYSAKKTTANEVLRVISVTDTGNLEASRGINGNAATIADDTPISNVFAAIADNGVACTSNAGTDQTITVNSTNAQTVEVFQVLRTPIPTTTTGTGIVEVSAASDVASATDTAWTFDAVTGLDVGDVGTVTCTTPAGRFEQVTLTTDNTTGSVTRAVNGSTACETVADAAAVNWYPWHATEAGAVGANGTMLTINGLSGKETYAKRQLIQINTPKSTGGYTGSFTVNATNAGEALVAVKGARTGLVYAAGSTTDSEGIIHITFRGAPSDYKDLDGDGKYDVGASPTEDRSYITNTASVATSTTTTKTDTITYDFVDSAVQQLVGTATLTLLDAPSTVVFSNSGTQSLTQTTTTSADTAVVKGLPGTGNFRYTYSIAYTGTTGDLTISTGVIHRTNNTLSSLTMSLQNRNFGETVYSAHTGNMLPQTNDDGNIARSALTTGDNGDDEIDGLYALYVVGTDSAGNPANALVTFSDDDGLATKGLGISTAGVILDSAAYGANTSGHTNTLQLGSTGKARTGIDIATAGIYNITAKDAAKALSSTVTLNVRGVAKTYTLTGPDAIEPGAVGVFTVWAYDANGFKLSADKAITIVNANSQTGGAIVPANGSGTISKSTGLTISVIAPQKGGTGTLAIVSGGAVVASKSLTYAAAVTGAALSGTGCTGSATGSYTCVVTSGDTASAVATAAGAVSIWQSDADGVLQGYVVGTPDFVDTGLASTADIASNSAIIVVR